jgi:hypothetical protein
MSRFRTQNSTLEFEIHYTEEMVCIHFKDTWISECENDE